MRGRCTREVAFDWILVAVFSALLSSCDVAALLGGRHSSSSGSRVAWSVSGRARAARPAFDGSTVFFISDTNAVHAFDAETGEHRWTSAIGSASTGLQPDLGGCALAGPVVVCSNGDLFGFDRSSGQQRWKYHPSQGYYPGYVGFIASDGIVYAGSPSKYVYAVSADGIAQWETAVLPADTDASLFKPAVADHLVIVPYTQFVNKLTGGVVAVDRKTGVLQWRTPFPRVSPDSMNGSHSVAIWGNTVLASSADGRIYALNLETGAILWNFPGVGTSPPTVWAGVQTPGKPFGADAPRYLAVRGATLYAGSISGWMVAYDLINHQELWRVTAGVGSVGWPVIAGVDGGDVYAIQDNGMLAAYVSDHSALSWRLPDNFDDLLNFYGEPVEGNGLLFVSANKGYYAIRK